MPETFSKLRLNFMDYLERVEEVTLALMYGVDVIEHLMRIETGSIMSIMLYYDEWLHSTHAHQLPCLCCILHPQKEGWSPYSLT